MLSKKAWESVELVVDAIKKHPFNVELMKGILDKETFGYYIEQDSIYLREFARCHSIIAAKAPAEYIKDFIDYAKQSFIAEEKVVHEFFKDTFNFKESGTLTPATVGYTSYILQACSLQPVEVGIAAILPCFWVYLEVGRFISKHSCKNNPYERWISTYGGEEFSIAVEKIIKIFDHLGKEASEKTRIKMLEAFHRSTVFEWYFWDDCYNNRVFDLQKHVGKHT
jgi:thiaminase/transcriptional activator TenA